MSEQTPRDDLVERLRAPANWLRQERGDDWKGAVNHYDRAPLEAADRIERLRKACARQNAEICQVLGKALGYPWFKDDPANFPDATEEHGVCVGDHVAESLADEAAKRIERLERALLETRLADLQEPGHG